MLDSWWWFGVALLVGLAVVAVTYRGYGSNWDEAVQARYGELALEEKARAVGRIKNLVKQLRHF